MAIQSSFPALRPSLLLDFANAKRLDPRVTFTRASTARFYDGSTVAKAEENLVLQSQEFDNAAWTKTIGMTVTANTIAAPDGTTTADTVEFIDAAISRVFSPEVTMVGGIATASFFVKYIDKQWVAIRLTRASSAETFVYFDIQNGVVGTVGADITASISATSNGFYRCVASITGLTGQRAQLYGVAADNSSSNIGQTGSIYLWGAQLENRSAVTAYTPTTTQAITNYVPVLQTAASGVPRFDHNPITGESLGLLIEESRTNLALRSEEFDNAAWSTTNATVTANAIIAPDGTLTADKLVADTTNGQHRINFTPTSGAGAQTFSVFCKAAEYSNVWLRIGTTGVGFNLATQTTFDSSPGFTGTFFSLGNGWYRCAISGTASANDIARINIVSSNNVVSADFVGNNFNGIYIWGAQLEAGAFPTSYIQTVAATVTRQADAASMTGANFTSWYDASEGTLYGEAFRDPASMGVTSNFFVQIDDATGNNAIGLYHNALNSRFFINTNNVTQAAENVTNGFSTGRARIAGAYKTNDIRQATGGTLSPADTSGLIPIVNQLRIGGFWNGTIRKLAYYPARITDAQLQAITG